jgi:hypothetical protein
VDAAHRRKVDNQAVVNGAEARATMPTTSNSDLKPVLAPEVHGGDDVANVAALRNQPWVLVDHPVVHAARGVVVRIPTRYQLAA